MAENNFQNTVEALFRGMDSFITTKTVVGDAITVGDTIILPLVDVSFGVAAGAFAENAKNNGGGGGPGNRAGCPLESVVPRAGRCGQDFYRRSQIYGAGMPADL